MPKDKAEPKGFCDVLAERSEQHMRNDLTCVVFPALCPLLYSLNASFQTLPPEEKESWLYVFLTYYQQASAKKAGDKSLNHLVGYKLADLCRGKRLVAAMPDMHERLDCCIDLGDKQYFLLFSVTGGFEAVDRVSKELKRQFKIPCHISQCGPVFLPITDFPFSV